MESFCFVLFPPLSHNRKISFAVFLCCLGVLKQTTSTTIIKRRRADGKDRKGKRMFPPLVVISYSFFFQESLFVRFAFLLFLSHRDDNHVHFPSPMSVLCRWLSRSNCQQSYQLSTAHWRGKFNRRLSFASSILSCVSDSQIELMKLDIVNYGRQVHI